MISTIVAVMLATKASATGYNESSPRYYGVDMPADDSSTGVSYSYGPLKLRGVIFGQAEAGGPSSFMAWAKTVTCPTLGASGYTCVDWAIQNASYHAAEGVQQATPQNIFNLSLIHI